MNKCIDCHKKIHLNSKRCRSCNSKYFNKLHKKDKHPSYKTGLPKCIDCKKEVSYNNERCWDCYCIWIKNPENHPNYIDGHSFEPYTPEFNETLKESIRIRDNYECQNCGMTEEEHLIVIGSVLCIHHIDYNKQNCKENNLISLCLQCHIRANYNRDYWYAYFIYLMENKCYN